MELNPNETTQTPFARQPADILAALRGAAGLIRREVAGVVAWKKGSSLFQVGADGESHRESPEGGLDPGPTLGGPCYAPLS